MEVTRNTLTARYGAPLSCPAAESGLRAMWRLGFPANGVQPQVHAVGHLAGPGPGAGRAPAHPRPTVAHRWRGRSRAGSPGHAFPFLGALFPSPGRPCPRGCSGGGPLPPPAPPPAQPLGHTLDLHPLEVFPVKAQPEGEKPADLCTDAEIRRREAFPERGLAVTGRPWAWASSC